MIATKKYKHPYNVCAIDVGSPKQNNVGWYHIDNKNEVECFGKNLDKLIPLVAEATKHNGLILGFEAPIIIPVRDEFKELTSARACDGSSAWSGSVGANVSVINIPIMGYVFKGIKKLNKNITFFLNEEGFAAQPNQIMIYEAFVTGKDKQRDHIGDAKYMAKSCQIYAEERVLPPTVLEPKKNTEYFNFAAAVLLRCGFEKRIKSLNLETPIYKPNPEALKML